MSFRQAARICDNLARLAVARIGRILSQTAQSTSMRPVVYAAAFAMLMPLSSSADDWPNWLGPHGDGVWRETGILEQIPESGLKQVWSTPVQGGYSGPAVADGRVYVMDFIPDKSTEGDAGMQRSKTGTERVLCLDAGSGEQLWEHKYQTELNVSYPGGPRTTPVVDGTHVFAMGTMGQLFCFHTESGEIVWQTDLADQYSAKPPIWGFAANPLIVGDQLICTVGGEGSGIVSLNKSTGKEIWRSITAREIGYAPPVLAELAGRRQLVLWYDVAITGIDLETGEELWSYGFPKEKPQRPVVSIVPPHIHNDRVFVTNFYHGSALIEINEAGATEIWTTEKDIGHKSDINSIMSTVIMKDNCYIGVAGNGTLRCVQADDGSLVWQSYQALATSEEDPEELPRGFKGFPSLFVIPHQDHYWMFTDQGELLKTQLSQTGYEELGRAKLLDTTATTRGRAYVWCPPAFANGHLFVRNEQELICVDMRAATYSNQ